MPDFPDLSHLLPPIGPETRLPAPAMTLRHPTEADATALVDRLADWSDHREDAFPGRARFRHFGGSSWLAEADSDRRPLGLLLGFASTDRPDEVVIDYVAIDPAFRRKGIGSTLVGRFEQAARDAGARRSTVACRPDDRGLLAFFGTVGYAPVDGPGAQRLYGVPAYVNWDGPGQDRAVLEHLLG